MIKIIRTDSANTDFIELVKMLDADLAIRDGVEHSFYQQFNAIDSINNVVIAFADDRPVSCGAFKVFGNTTAEVKRMYTVPEYRGKGIASLVLKELEGWGRELAFSRFILETGWKQPEAIRLYEKNGYRQFPNYGQYAGVENSVCFEKMLIIR